MSSLRLQDTFFPRPVNETISWSEFVLRELRSTMIVAFAVTFTAGLRRQALSFQFIIGPEYDLDQYLDDFAKHVQQEELPALEEVSHSKFSNHITVGREDLRDTTMVRTQEGFLGLGPRLTQEGDEIWLPMGAYMPFIFRPVGKGRYKILGQVYLHGAIKGEAVKDMTEDDFEEVYLC